MFRRLHGLSIHNFENNDMESVETSVNIAITYFILGYYLNSLKTTTDVIGNHFRNMCTCKIDLKRGIDIVSVWQTDSDFD